MKPETEKELRAETERYYARKYSDDEWAAMLGFHIKKKRAHAAVSKAIRSGDITKRKCCFCQSWDTVAHHPNYDYPLDVLWVCHSHHQLEHSALRKMSSGQRAERNYEVLMHVRRVADLGMLFALVNDHAFDRDEYSKWFDYSSPPEIPESFIEYDEAEVARGQIESDCGPVFSHPSETPEPQAPACCPTCKRPLP